MQMNDSDLYPSQKTMLKAGFVALAVAFTLLLCYVGYDIYGIYRETQAFPNRHVQATDAINRIYAYYTQHGQWPAEEQVERAEDRWLPPNWHYECRPEEKGGVVVLTGGALHCLLLYRFAPPVDGVASKTWIFLQDDNGREFETNEDYAVNASPEM